jgi:putative DNA methylase
MNANMSAIVPFSLKDAPSLIERVFPSMKLSAEAQKERKANLGQTLTTLGSYWKGRKPLILVRACILASLLPATSNPEKDLQIFELLLGIADSSFKYRVKNEKDLQSVLSLNYTDRVSKVLRPEEMPKSAFLNVWKDVNAHLGTSANSFEALVEQLGIMRFGQKPRVADTFAGGGSIPFEAARLGCDVYAADLNPVACMLTWASLNVVGASESKFADFANTQETAARRVDQVISSLKIEHDESGNRAKAYLYCIEVVCPETGWRVPILPSRIISKPRRVVVNLVPILESKSYDFVIREDVSADEMAAAERGTLIDGRVIHLMNPNSDGVALTTIRGDSSKSDGVRSNGLRSWDKSDVRPRIDDVLQERLYAIQWVSKKSLQSSRHDIFYRAPNLQDIEREARVDEIVMNGITLWQSQGLVPDMIIEKGDETARLTKERGWTHWHHLFNPRQLLLHKLYAEEMNSPEQALANAKALDWNSRICHWIRDWDKTAAVFYNQSLNTFFNYGTRGYLSDLNSRVAEYKNYPISTQHRVINAQASDVEFVNDLYVTDPPYADAVNYHEISEFFIAWLRKNHPVEFEEWNWDSRRRLAIKGKGEEFRSSMVRAYRAMADKMSANGIQVVMFTHQDGKVWSDMAQIFWGAGLQVMADWYIATETNSELKKGGYVQGTHIIVLRKRTGNDSGYSDEITQEVKEEVARQIEEMVGLNQSLRGHGRSENLFNDADLQMAGYAAALRVLTKYVKIDGKDMTVEALRPRAKNERTVIDDIIEYAVQVANEHLVPEGMAEQTWRKLTGTERFYLKMMDIETTGSKKVDNYQNFAKAFRVSDYGLLMSSVAANNAALKSAADFGKRQMGDDEFGSSPTRAILYALWEMKNGVDDDAVLGHLRDLTGNYLDQRGDLQVIADYIAAKRSDIDATDSQNATILAGLIKNERLG